MTPTEPTDSAATHQVVDAAVEQLADARRRRLVSREITRPDV